MELLVILSIITVVFYLIDRFKGDKIPKVVLHVLLFIWFCVIGILLLLEYGLIFVFSFPVLLIVYVLICRKKGNTTGESEKV